MDRHQYVAALAYCYKVETAGAIAGEVCMLLRQDPVEKRKLDIFRRLEASNKILCGAALRREGVARPTVDPTYYRGGYQLGLKFAEGDWVAFLDCFEATVHPEAFAAYVHDDQGNEISHEYGGVDANLLRHLLNHEESLVEFITFERQGKGQESTTTMQDILDSQLCAGLIGPEDPVGW